MPWPKKSRAKGERVIRRKLRDGTIKEYRYAKYAPHVRNTRDSLEALIEAYRHSPEWAALAPQTKAGRNTYLKPLQDIGHLAAKALRRRDIMTIRDAMIEARGPGSANGFLAASTALFRWALDREWIETLPTLAVKRAASGHLRPWTREEADKAGRELPEHLRRAVVLARHTGQRRGDLCAMSWSAYDGAAIRLTQQKTKPGAKPVVLVIPAAPALRAELDQWKATATAVTVLTNAAGRPWKLPSLSHVLPKALVKIGLSPELGIHGLRKLAATELADAGCTPHQIAAITGHRTLAMVELYTRSADQETLAQSAVIQLSERKITTTERKNDNLPR